MSMRWASVSLRDLVEPIETSDPRKSPDAYFTYIDVSSVARETLSVREAVDVLGADAPSRARRRVREGDVIFATIRPTLKRVAQIPRELDGAICSTGFFVLRPRQGVLGRYLFYWLLGDEFSHAMATLQRGASYPAVSDGDVKSQHILVPSLAEQKRIVAILDEAFAGIDTAIANTEKNIANADELFDRYLNSLFDGPQWSGKKLEDLGTVQTGNTPKTAEKGNYGNYVPFIKPGDFLGDGSLNYSNQALSRRGAEKARLLPRGAVLMVCIGATIGKAGYTEQEITTNQQINALSPGDEYSAKFIYYQMLSDRFQRSVMSSAGQATLPIVSKKKWSNLEIRVPPTLSEQCAVVEKLDELDLEVRRLSRNYHLKRANLQELKQSLLQKAFTGEFTAGEMETEATEAVAV